MRATKRLLWWILVGSAGGYNRARILHELTQTPRNTNELATILNLDYKTTRHHLDFLEKNRLIITVGNRYGLLYFPSDLLEENMHLFKEIWDEITKHKKNKTIGEKNE